MGIDQDPLFQLVQPTPPAPVKKQPTSKPIPSNSKLPLPTAPKQRKPKPPSTVPLSDDPEKNRIHQEIIGIINEVYEDETAGPYFLNALIKIPSSFVEDWKHSWATFASNHIAAKRRNTIKWNQLKERLLSLNLIEEGKGKIVLRKF